MCIYTYIYICMCVCVCIYNICMIYIYLRDISMFHFKNLVGNIAEIKKNA